MSPRLLACAALLALAPLPAFAQAYVGTWAADPAQCRNGQEVQEAPMILKAKRFDQHEAHCTFSSVTKKGATWSVRARCTVEGNQINNNFTLRVDGNTLIMGGSGKPQTYQRCP